MANRRYIFAICDCKGRKNQLLTLSARKAKSELCSGTKVEVWSNDGELIEVVYTKYKGNLDKYVRMEKEYISYKQAIAESVNNKRRNKNGSKYRC